MTTHNLQAAFALSAFGDEIASGLEEQLRVLADLKISGLELRAAWNVNVAHFSDNEAHLVRRLCDEAGVIVTCLGSPIGKTPIGEPLQAEEERLLRLFQIAEIVGTRHIRIFSFYPPHGADANAFIEDATQRLSRLTELAARDNFQLLLENERDLVGDIPVRCAAIMRAINNPHLRFIWDPANFVLSGAPHPIDAGWAQLAPFVDYIHVKDARAESGAAHVAGDGEGQIPELLQHLVDKGYRGILALEPHLAVAGHSSGFSGEEGMTRAVDALRRVLARVGAPEISARDLTQQPEEER
jgi:sugar phosphate isomerase/epimerase